ncbi:MAG: SPOR domain-containing protein [Owenweeksia sp.]
MKFFVLISLIFSLASGISAQPATVGQGNFEVIEEPGIRQLHQAYIRENKDHPGFNGYRVQIYNGRKDACMSKRSQFISVFPTVAAYTLYEAPEYRIQVGDFRTRLEAEKFLQIVLSEFSGSFVVSTRIKLPHLEPETSLKQP